VPKIRQHVNALKSDLLEIPNVPRLVARADSYLEVELGSAEAQFLIERAAVVPEATLVGVEIRREMITRAERLCREAGAGNVRNVFANMSVDLGRLFAPRSVRRFHVNFPDPWWKARQHKRRVVGAGLIGELATLLEPGGEIHVMTDIFDIALEAMASLEEEGPGTFVNAHAPWSFYRQPLWGARSRREAQCDREGERIWRLLYHLADRPFHSIRTGPVATKRSRAGSLRDP
jgi:tRNA (guanine-N7-)-methyltransferase